MIINFQAGIAEIFVYSREKSCDYFKFMFNRCKFYLPEFGETRTLNPLNRTASVSHMQLY